VIFQLKSVMRSILKIMDKNRHVFLCQVVVATTKLLVTTLIKTSDQRVSHQTKSLHYFHSYAAMDQVNCLMTFHTTSKIF